MSPQNRPLTYSYSATGGTVTGSGTTAELLFGRRSHRRGRHHLQRRRRQGPHGNRQHQRDHRGSACCRRRRKTQALCSISFAKDNKRPTRVDNEAKACLDEVALDLQQAVGCQGCGGRRVKRQGKGHHGQAAEGRSKHKKAKVEDFAAQRAVNTKDYLVTEKGIDASRVSVATGTTDGQTVETTWCPPAQPSPAMCTEPLRWTRPR